MKKNRAILVALIVLAAAALLMIFAVLPQMRGNKTVEALARKAGETVEQAKDTAKKTLEQAKSTIEQATADPKADADAKMARLKADGEAATVEFEALFSDGKQPTVEQIAAAKAKLETALKSASELTAPEGLDAATARLIASTAEGARNALTLLEAMPTDAIGAKNAFDALKATMMAALSGKEAPGTTAVSVQQDVAEAEDAKPGDSADVVKPADKAVAKPVATTAIKPSETAGTVLPSFDVLRVEPDGSTLIAGHAAPGKKIDILDGNTAIASTEAGDSGDFVAVLDNPLPAGDHQLVLQSTGKDGKKVVSAEVATVSVPADKSGELLAMVTKPGEASRIMTMPESKKETVVAQNTEDMTAKTVAEQSKVAVEPAKDMAVSAKTETEKVDIAKSAEKKSATPEKGDASSDVAKSAPVVKKDAVTETMKKSDAAADTTVPSAAKDATKTEPVQVAANEAAAVSESTTKEVKPAPVDVNSAEKSVTAPEVLVSAVEIEGSKIFVAGTARPKAVVRVYADDKLVAQISTDENGRFVADSTLPLSVGNHTIRADLLSADGKRVEFRASVPFFRPEGEQLAAVAGNDAAMTDDKAMKPLADGAYDNAREEAGKAISLLKGLYTSGRTPTLDELAAARSATEIALKTLSQIKVTDDVDPVAKEMADDTAGKAAKALELLKSLPQDAGAVKSALNSIDDAVTSAVAPTMDTAEAGKTATDVQKTDDAAKAEQPKPKLDDALSAASREAKPLAKQNMENTIVASADDKQPKVIEQAPLKPSQSSVIIRRGDTLWHISRRVYGRGVRYTTIYVANEDQIINPDQIMPGQIFGVPDQYLPNSEELHRERLDHKKH